MRPCQVEIGPSWYILLKWTAQPYSYNENRLYILNLHYTSLSCEGESSLVWYMKLHHDSGRGPLSTLLREMNKTAHIVMLAFCVVVVLQQYLRAQGEGLRQYNPLILEYWILVGTIRDLMSIRNHFAFKSCHKLQIRLRMLLHVLICPGAHCIVPTYWSTHRWYSEACEHMWSPMRRKRIKCGVRELGLRVLLVIVVLSVD